jgi:hypothetical protein
MQAAIRDSTAIPNPAQPIATVRFSKTLGRSSRITLTSKGCLWPSVGGASPLRLLAVEGVAMISFSGAVATSPTGNVSPSPSGVLNSRSLSSSTPTFFRVDVLSRL